MRFLITILFCFLLTSSYADEFKVDTFYVDESDVTALKTNKLDESNQLCSIIKIKSDISGVIFEPGLGLIETISKDGEYWVFVSSGEKKITIRKKDGFMAYLYIVKTPIESGKVYVMKLTSKDKKGKGRLILKSDPSDIWLEINGVKARNTPLDTMLLSGDYNIKLIKDAYILDETNQIQKIHITPFDTNKFTIKLKIDLDKDGVPDERDKCLGTKQGYKVKSDGCPPDEDNDGIPDVEDKCPETKFGYSVDKNGCPLDEDADGIPDKDDMCPHTSKLKKVDEHGCPIERFPHISTLHIGINIALMKNTVQGGFGVSVYYPIGLFFSGYKKYNNSIPIDAYTPQFVENIKYEYNINNTPYTDLQYQKSQSNLKTYNWGIYFSPIKYIYLQAGLSFLKGTVWDEYSGDFGNRMSAITSNGSQKIYALNKQNINSKDLLIGLAVVFPYAQIEAGYNKLFDDFYVNFGINYPIKKVKLIKRY